MTSNLPQTFPTDSSAGVKQFFNNFFTHEVTFPSNQIDATVGFFLKRDFDVESARTTSIVLLNQARIDNVNVMELLDSMKTLTDVQLSQLVAQVLNASREKTSILGYRIATVVNQFEARNILV